MDATLIGLLFVVHWKRIDSSVARPGKRDDNARKSAGSDIKVERHHTQLSDSTMKIDSAKRWNQR